MSVPYLYANTDLLQDNSDYARNDLGDKSNPAYLIRIIKDAIDRGSNI